MKVVIAGAGLVGAATALALRQVGIECTMYDQVNLADAIQKAKGGILEPIDFGESGGAVLLSFRGLRVLKDLGLLDEIRANSFPAPITEFFKIDGSAPISIESTKVAAYAGECDPDLQCPLHILRSKLHDILVKAGYKAGAKTFVGKKLVGVKHSETGVTAQFADGTTATGDLLIGADGIHSTTRRKVFGEDLKAHFTGVIGHIGVVNLERHKIRLAEACAFYIDREHKQMVCAYKVSETTAAIQVVTFNDPDPEEVQGEAYRPYSDLPKHSERLADLIQGWGVPSNLVKMIRHAHRISPSSIYDLPDLETYHKDRVLLIGDAAHGMVPNAALGLGTGLEDVGILMELLKQLPNTSDLPKVLGLYSKLRIPRATDNSQRSRNLAAQYYTNSVFGAGFGHFVMRVGLFALNHNLVKIPGLLDCSGEVSNAIAEYSS
ncbi:hypothetical protein HDU98_000071 [Podochytrium sp. JEL0797]|nr:hypothetical protein HDU98_000071 [Podochytrium sp. JEL0797]